MDDDAFEDYLTEKAKELLRADDDARDAAASTAPPRQDGPDTPDAVTMAEDGVDGPTREDGFSSDEMAFLDRNRAQLDNDELRAFLQADSAFHDDLDAAADTRFRRWEERLMIQANGKRSADAIADELDRDVAAVRTHMRKLGLTVDDPADDQPGRMTGQQ